MLFKKFYFLIFKMNQFVMAAQSLREEKVIIFRFDKKPELLENFTIRSSSLPTSFYSTKEPFETGHLTGYKEAKKVLTFFIAKFKEACAVEDKHELEDYEPLFNIQSDLLHDNLKPNRYLCLDFYGMKDFFKFSYGVDTYSQQNSSSELRFQTTKDNINKFLLKTELEYAI